MQKLASKCGKKSQKPHPLSRSFGTKDGPPNVNGLSQKRCYEFKGVPPAYRSPWQNGVAERWVQSCRRDLFDHVIVVNERHLKRLLSEYVRYYHEDRTHLGLNKETPGGRIRSKHRGRVIAQARLGGLHHRYDRAA